MNYEVRSIVCQLKFISFIKKNQKVCTKQNRIYDNNWYDGIYRSIIIPEDRMDTINYIQSVLDKTYKAILQYEENSSILITCLREVTFGIENLKYTYSEDPYIKGLFDAMLIEISNQVDKHNHA